MYNVGLYARYSTVDQAETSIEDQIRRCRKLVERQKLTVGNEFVFQDSAISGSAKAQASRSGYQELISAIVSQKINCLIVDEISRLSRDTAEVLRLKELIEKYHLLFLTVNGIDSRSQDWAMRMALTGILGQAELDNIRHMTKRGMQGQLERGFMLASPAYGYSGMRVTVTGTPAVTNDEVAGTTWIIDEAEAAIVKKMFSDRITGTSFATIARNLNSQGIAPPRPKKGDASAWMPSTVHQIMRNPIYKGIFVYRGSSAYRYNASKSGAKNASESAEYPRPQLRLVSDEVWFKCNRSSRKTRKPIQPVHILAGVVTCGRCGGTLAITSASHNCRSLYCPGCERKKAVGVGTPIPSASVAVEGVMELIKNCLRKVLSDPENFSDYQTALRVKLNLGKQQNLQAIKTELSAQERSYQTALDKYLAGNDDEELKANLSKLSARINTLKVEHQQLEQQRITLDETSLQQHLKITQDQLIRHLLNRQKVYWDRLRPILKKLFPDFQFAGRNSEGAAVFDIRADLATAVAAATGSDRPVVHLISGRYAVQATKTRPTIWHVTECKDNAQS